jgi:hypothetical protein
MAEEKEMNWYGENRRTNEMHEDRLNIVS